MTLKSRAAFHLGRITPYAGFTLGLDTNYVYVDALNASETALGVGTNLDFGVAVMATPQLSLDFGGDYHPGTDTIAEGAEESIEYFAFRFGARLHL